MSEPRFSMPAHPAGYSHAVSLARRSPRWTSGQIAVDSSASVPSGWAAQTHLVFENLGRALAAADAAWPDVVKLTIFSPAEPELETIRAVRRVRR